MRSRCCSSPPDDLVALLGPQSRCRRVAHPLAAGTRDGRATQSDAVLTRAATIAPPHRHRLPRKTPLLWKWETEAVSDAYTSAGPACCHPTWSPGFDSHLVVP